MNVCQGRQAGHLANLGEDRHGVFQTDAPRGAGAGPVRLVETGFVDDADIQPLADFLKRMGRFQRVLAALHLARTGDESDSCAAADDDRRPKTFGQRNDSVGSAHEAALSTFGVVEAAFAAAIGPSVSYTHLTLPTICSV